MKSNNRKKVGLLQPIPIPNRKWEQIATDLVTDLPPSGGYTTIIVFVDRLTKMVHFAPCTKEISADQYTRLVINNVFQVHTWHARGNYLRSGSEIYEPGSGQSSSRYLGRISN